MSIMMNWPLVAVECCNCHTLFAMTQEMHNRRHRDHKLFYCPQGHSQHFTGKTDDERSIARLQKELATANSNHSYWKRKAESAISCGETKKRKLANARGQITKLRKKYEPEDVSEEQ